MAPGQHEQHGDTEDEGDEARERRRQASPSHAVTPATHIVRRLPPPGCEQAGEHDEHGQRRDGREVVDPEERVDSPAAMVDVVVDADDVGDDASRPRIRSISAASRSSLSSSAIAPSPIRPARPPSRPRPAADEPVVCGSRQEPQSEQRHRRGEQPVSPQSRRAAAGRANTTSATASARKPTSAGNDRDARHRAGQVHAWAAG